MDNKRSDHQIDFVVEKATVEEVTWIVSMLELLVRAMGLKSGGGNWVLSEGEDKEK
jgi:hypothetical protein